MSAAIRFSIVACSVLLLVACDRRSPVEPVPGQNSVVVTRADGTTVAIASNVWAWCDAWEAGVVPEPTVHVLMGSQAARWELRLVQRDVRIGQPLAFPNSFIWDQPRNADLFVHDPPNELSTQQGNSSGSVTVEHLDCRANGGVRLRIDAVVGSEYGDLPPVTVRGSFASPWTSPPGS
jgi:hypothetical protein